MKNVIEIENLTKYYGKARGIVDVSFSVAEGEVFGFIGPNGAGKSTTIRILLNLIYPTSGSASVFGRDCVRDGHEIRKGVGYLPSEVFYYDDMRVLELLKYSASFYGRVDMERLRYLANVMELDISRKIDDLSYGNKKKVGIVQGLLHRPSLIILDEPTGGLDPLMQQRFFGLIREENQRGATVLFSSHILPEVQKLCSRVGIIREGRMLRVEDIGAMRDTAYKKIRLEFREELSGAPVLPEGAGDVKCFGQELSFLFRGDINAAFAAIARFDLQNAVIEEPDLEEIFLHYYNGEDTV